MKPVIGIVGRITLVDGNVRNAVTDSERRAIIGAGGIPFLILPPQNIDYYHLKGNEVPPMTEEEKAMLDEQLSFCKGIVLPGGNRMYEYDYYVLEYAICHDIPILGICMGMQVMWNYPRYTKNIKNETSIEHHSKEPFAHSVTLLDSSLLCKICGEVSFQVNSQHHYHINEKETSNYYQIVGYSEDGLSEAIECPRNRFNIGVQWHPELLLEESEISKRLFAAFLSYCKDL